MSNNMPFASCEFQAFAKEGRVKLTTSSPTYAQSNGQVERFVYVVKQMLRKAGEEGRDPYLTLPAYHNTAVTGMSSTGDQTVDGSSPTSVNTFLFGTLAIPFTPLCQCFSDETVKTVGPFHMVSMPGEVKDPTSPYWDV